MSQTALPAPGVRPQQSAGEGPDFLFVVRHYRWLIVLGTLLGLAIGTGLYFTLKAIAPKYKSEAMFMVRGKESPLLERGATAEEISQYIRTQAQLFMTDDFFADVMKVEKVTETRWYKRARPTPAAALKEALKVEPLTGTNLFRVTLTISERDEVDVILNEICDTYVRRLDRDKAKERDNDLRAFRGTVSSAESALNKARQDAEDYRILHDVNALLNTRDVAVSTLGALQTKMEELIFDRNAIKASLDGIVRDQQDPSYKLPPELDFVVMNVPTIRTLEEGRLGLERRRDVAIAQFGPGHATVRAIQLEIDAVVKQYKEQRAIEEERAKQRQLQGLGSQLAAAEARISELKKKVDERQIEVRRLDNDLVGYRRLEENVRVSQDEVNRNKMELNRQEGIYNTTQQRVENWQKPRRPNPDEIASPTMMGYLPAGAALGLGLSFALAYILELTNTRVRTPRDITRTMQLPLLGFVPDQEDDDMLHGDLSTSIRTAPSSMTAESFRQIRGRLAAQSDGSALRSILVSSIAPGGGATTVASNLANGLALNGRRVLLVDANFYRPALKNIYRNVPSVGFSDLLTNAAQVDAAITQAADMPNLFIMGAGSQPTSGSSELLESVVCRDVLAKLRDKFDVVIFDGAPLSLVSDSVSLSSKVDGVIAVVRAGRISRGTVARVRDQLRHVRANLLGVVLNAAQTQSSGYFKENYRSFYRYANGSVGTANGHAAGRQPAQTP